MDETRPPVRTPLSQPDLTGATVGRYIIRAHLGAGGMGEVYRAEDPKLRRVVAIKRWVSRGQADEAEASRLLREGQRLSALNHPNIASVYDVLEEQGEIFLVMECVEGQTLRQRLHSPLSVEQFFEIGIQSADALTAAHERGILHGDVKPENIMLTTSGHVKLLDFGVARRLSAPGNETLTATTQGMSALAPVAGTTTYMAPEVLMGSMPDFRADIFSLGVVYYEMLGGRHPFLGPTTTATAVQILQQEPPPLDKLGRAVPEPLARVVGKALHKDPDKRYQTPREIAADLRAVRGGTQPSVPAVPRFSRSQRSKFVVVAAVLAVAGALLIPVVRQAVRARFAGKKSALLAVPAASQPQTLAVLPLRLQGEDPKLRAFGNGLIDSVTARLSQLSETHPLTVISAPRVEDAKVETAKQALDEFSANLGLEVSLERSQDLLRATYTVTDSKTNRAISGDTVTAPETDPFALEDKVADGVVRALKLELRPDERASLNLHGTAEPAAYDYYLHGTGYLLDISRPENVANALAMFDQAIHLDPNYGLAYAGRGKALWEKSKSSHDKKWVEASRSDCERAVTLGNAGSEGHLCLGMLAAGTGEYNSAITEFQRALELDPTNDETYIQLAATYKKLNKPDEAEKTFLRAIELRPQDRRAYDQLGTFYLEQAQYDKAEKMFQRSLQLAPDSYVAYSNLGGVYLFMGRDADAITMLERSIRIRGSSDAYSNLGTAYFRERRFADAVRNYREAVKFEDKDPDLWGNLGDACLFGGQKDEARKAYQRQLDLLLAQQQVNPKDGSIEASLAACYAGLGDRKNALDHLDRSLQWGRGDKNVLFSAAAVYNQLGETGVALEWLRKALSAGYSPSVVRDAPIFDNLRADPTFQQLVQSSAR
jgi:serine/threonine-protein kinase